MNKYSIDNRCTFYPNGNWLACCAWHDLECADAWLQRSAEMRLKADQDLRQCVINRGHPVHAEIIYAGVRAWYWFRWWLIAGI